MGRIVRGVRRLLLRVIEAVLGRLPLGLLQLLARLRTSLIWTRSSVREHARRQMLTLGPHLTPAELESAARRHVTFSGLRRLVRFNPGALVRQRVFDLEHLTDLDDASGVIFGFFHQGHYEGTFPSVARHHARSITVVVAEEALQDEPPLWATKHVEMITSHPSVTLVGVSLGFRGIRDLLRSGHAVALACDIPGSQQVEVTFCGQPRMATTSAAALSLATGAPILPVWSIPQGRYGAAVRLGAPIAPADHVDAEVLTAAVVAALEPGAQQWPEAYDLPAQMWRSPSSV